MSVKGQARLIDWPDWHTDPLWYKAWYRDWLCAFLTRSIGRVGRWTKGVNKVPENATSARHGHENTVCQNGSCHLAPQQAGSNRRCRCRGSWAKSANGKCSVCSGYVYADWEWELLIGDADAAGLVVTVTAYTRTHDDKKAGGCVKITNVKADGITFEESGGVRVLILQGINTNRKGYIPFIEWFTTEVQERVY
jgi:hypothetical protein